MFRLHRGVPTATGRHRATQTARRNSTAFLINRDFRWLWWGQASSILGDFVFETTLTIWVAKVLFAHSRWAPATVSGLTLCTLVGVMVVGPFAGVFVDRWERRRTMLASEVLRGLLVGLMTPVTLLPPHALPDGVWLGLLYTVVFVVTATGQFFNPARFATIGEVVAGEADRARAFGLVQATTATTAIIGPAVAAPVLFTFGVQWALLFNSASYALSFLTLRAVRFPAAPPGSAARPEPTGPAARPAWRAEFAAGLKMFARNRFLVGLLSIAVVTQLGTGALNALDIFFLTDNLHVAPKLLGVVSTAAGLGSVVGALVSGRLVRLVSARHLTWLGLVARGLLMTVYARQTHFVPALILMFVLAIPVAALNTALSPLLLAAAPKEYLGRTMAVFNPVSRAASAISVAAAGSLASTVLRDFHATVAGVRVGPIDTVFTVSAILIIVAGVYAAVVLPADRRPAPDAAAPPARPQTRRRKPSTYQPRHRR